MSMKNSNDTIGNRTRSLPTCSAVPQPTALPRAPVRTGVELLNILGDLEIVVNSTSETGQENRASDEQVQGVCQGGQWLC